MELYSVTYLDFGIGIEEHDAYEAENFLSNAIRGPGQVRQDVDDSPHLIQFYLQVSDQLHLSVSTTATQHLPSHQSGHFLHYAIKHY